MFILSLITNPRQKQHETITQEPFVDSGGGGILRISHFQQKYLTNILLGLRKSNFGCCAITLPDKNNSKLIRCKKLRLVDRNTLSRSSLSIHMYPSCGALPLQNYLRNCFELLRWNFLGRSSYFKKMNQYLKNNVMLLG